MCSLLNHLGGLSRKQVLVLHSYSSILCLYVLSLLSHLALDSFCLLHLVFLLEFNFCLEISIMESATQPSGFVQIAWGVWTWLVVRESVRVCWLRSEASGRDQFYRQRKFQIIFRHLLSFSSGANLFLTSAKLVLKAFAL